MSPTMVRQGGQIQLEQSEMRLALNMGKKAKGGFSQATIEETHYLMWSPCAEVPKERKQGVLCRENRHVKAVLETHLDMVSENHTDGYLPWYIGTANNLQIRWRCTGTGEPLSDRCRQQTPDPTQTPPRTPYPLPCDNEGAQCSQINSVPARYAYVHAPLPNARCFKLHSYCK